MESKDRVLRSSGSTSSSRTQMSKESRQSSQPVQVSLDNSLPPNSMSRISSVRLGTLTPNRHSTRMTQDISENLSQSSLQNGHSNISLRNRQEEEASDYMLKQTPEYMLASPSYLAANPNIAFLLSCAQDMDDMTSIQRVEFKSKVLDLIKLIKYPSNRDFS